MVNTKFKYTTGK